jgi:hypothetical protein
MKSVYKIIGCVFLLSLLASCGGDKTSVIPEMKDFTANYFGSYQKVSEGLQKYGASNLEKKDMDIYDLTDPKITATEKKGNVTNYTLEAKAGITIRTYVLSWENGKIIEIQDKGIK